MLARHHRIDHILLYVGCNPQNLPFRKVATMDNNSTFLYENRAVFHFLSAFGLPPLGFDRKRNRVYCSSIRCCSTLIGIGIYMIFTIYLFVDFIYGYPANKEISLSNISKIFRGFSTTYAYPSLVVVVVSQRHRYSTFFNQLADIDSKMLSIYGVRTNTTRIRHNFWWHTVCRLVQYIVFALPFELLIFASLSRYNVASVFAYICTAMGMGVATVFAQYAVACCQLRYELVRKQLKATLLGRGHRRDVIASIQLLCDVDATKECLRASMSWLLTLKSAIDYLNVLASIYILSYIVLRRNTSGVLINIAHYVLYELPFIVSDVLMVRQFQSLGDEVSDFVDCTHTNNCVYPIHVTIDWIIAYTLVSRVNISSPIRNIRFTQKCSINDSIQHMS